MAHPAKKILAPLLALAWLGSSATAAVSIVLPTANTNIFFPGAEEHYFVGTVGREWPSGTFGCVRSDLDEVESVDTISERIKKGIDCVGHGRLLLDPDCGLRQLPPDAARAKLENMVKARDMVMINES